MIKLFFSNRIEYLFENLKQQLFAKSEPFAHRMIVVPTPAIKSWLLLQFAKDEELRIAAGLDIIYLNDSMNKIFDLLSEQKNQGYIPNQLELTLAIEGEIRKICSMWNTLTHEQKNLWMPLLSYLKVNVSFQELPDMTRRSERRLVAVARTLAKLFIEYGKYGKKMIEKWEEIDQDWQRTLWHLIFSKSWSYSSQKYQSQEFKQRNSTNLQVHLFSISFLPQSEYAFFEKSAAFLPVHFYTLSPCHLFWSDILTDKEALYLEKYWHHKGASNAEQDLLADYLRDKNPLLANWGKLNRKMMEQFEAGENETFTHYTLPSDLQNIEAYQRLMDESLGFEKRKDTSNLLDYLQADILLMRNPDKSEKISVKNQSIDSSIQIHYAPTKQREVQVLYNNLLDSIKKHGELNPSDMIVMAPNISDYAPYIKLIFGADNSQLDFQLMDMQIISQNSHFQQFWHLLELPFGKWNIDDMMYLVKSKTFQQKHQLTPEDVRQIYDWIKITGIQWGGNSHHRNEILHQKYCQGMVEATEQGTWEGGFSYLLQGLIMQTSQDSFDDCSLESSQGILLGKLINLLRCLHRDLKPLCNGTLKTYPEWVEEIKQLAKTYLFHIQQEDEGIESLFESLSEFSQAAQWMSNHKVSFIAVKKHLEKHLNQRVSIYRENHLHAVRFCSMLPMRAIPAKVIALLGMNENEFPRMEDPQSLNLMNGEAHADYCPSRTDFDRYLFLEALLSARSYFIVSSIKYAANDGKEQAPSILVTELLSYISHAFQISPLIQTHPYCSYNFQYFTKDSLLKNYSYEDYRLALRFYQREKQQVSSFFHDFKPQLSENQNLPSDIILDIKQINLAIRNPLKHYCNKILGIYLKDENELSSDEPFVVDDLIIHKVKKNSLSLGMAKSIHDAEKQSRMPLGIFKKVAFNTILKKVNAYHQDLEALGVDLKRVFKITLHEHYTEPLKDNLEWQLPPLIVNYKNQTAITIIGSFSEISERGLIANILGDKKDIVKVWVDFVLLNCIIDQYQLPIHKQLLCLKSKKIKQAFFENPWIELDQILDYYFQSLLHVSPLTEEWLHDLVFSDAQKLNNVMFKSLRTPFNPIYNDYIKWVCRANTLDANNVIEHWQPQARRLFSKIYKAWTATDE